MLTTAVLLIAVTVLGALRAAPVQGVAAGTVAIEAQAPGGITADLVNRAVAAAGAPRSSRMVLESTTAQTPKGSASVLAFGVDANLPGMLDRSVLPQGLTLFGPGSVYLSRGWAAEHGLGKGDTVAVSTPSGAKSWKVADLLDADFANSGAVVVAPLATMAEAFGRGAASDVVLLPAPKDAAARDAMAATLNGAGRVVAPDQLLSGYNRVFQTSLSILALYAGIAILTSSVVLFLTWRLVLTDAGPVLARLKLLGSRTRILAQGSALVMVPILLITYVIGTVAGLLLGRNLAAFTNQITNMTGQALNPGFPWVLPALGSFAGAAIMFAVAWLSGIQRLRRTAAIDAVTGRDQTSVARSRIMLPLLGSLALVLIGVLLVVLVPGFGKSAAIPPLFAGLCLTSALVPVVLGILVRRSNIGPTTLLVGRQLEVGWRRSAALSIMFAVALGSSVVMYGVSSSVKDDVAASVARWTTVPLLIQAAPLGHNLGNETLPADLGREIEKLPGIDATYTYSYTNIGYHGQRYQIWCWGGSSDVDDFVHLRMADGPSDFVDTFADNQVAISTNFARTQHLGMGDTLQLPRPDGHRDYRIGAIIDDSASDGGMIALPDKLYRELVGDNGVYSIGMRLKPGTSEAQARETVQNYLAERYPRAVVVTATQLRDGMASITGRLVGAFEAFAWVMFLVASAVGAATLASSLAERQTTMALVRLIGCRRTTMRWQMVAESLLIASSSWLVAIPIGLVTIPAAIGGLSFISGLLPPIAVPTALLVASVPLTLLAIAFALFVARRSSGEVPLASLMAKE